MPSASSPHGLIDDLIVSSIDPYQPAFDDASRVDLLQQSIIESHLLTIGHRWRPGFFRASFEIGQNNPLGINIKPVNLAGHAITIDPTIDRHLDQSIGAKQHGKVRAFNHVSYLFDKRSGDCGRHLSKTGTNPRCCGAPLFMRRCW